MAFLSTGAPRVISSWSLRKMPFRGWLGPRLASFLTSSGFPALTLSDILNHLMQAKHEAFLRVTRKEIKINLAQRETCFPLRKCCLCKHKHAPLSVSHAMQTLGRADLCGHPRWLVPPPPAPPSVAASALPHAGAGESAQTSTSERGTRRSRAR